LRVGKRLWETFLAFANTEHSSPTYRASTLGGWSSILQSHLGSVTDLLASSALYTVALHNLLLLAQVVFVSYLGVSKGARGVTGESYGNSWGLCGFRQEPVTNIKINCTRGRIVLLRSVLRHAKSEVVGFVQ